MRLRIPVTDGQKRALHEHGACILAESIQGTNVTGWNIGSTFYLDETYVRVISKQVEDGGKETYIIVVPAVE